MGVFRLPAIVSPQRKLACEEKLLWWSMNASCWNVLQSNASDDDFWIIIIIFGVFISLRRTHQQVRMWFIILMMMKMPCASPDEDEDFWDMRIYELDNIINAGG